MRKLLLISIVLLIGACTKSQFCIDPNPIQLRMVFKTYDSTGAKVDTPLVNADVYSTDTTVALVENQEALRSIDVFPNRKRNQQTYVIFNSNKRDTVIIDYTPFEYFISNGCGYQTHFTIDRARFSTANIDSVNISNASVNDNLKENIEVIYK